MDTPGRGCTAEEFAEPPLAHHRMQAGKVVVEAIDQPKPVLPVVDFDPFEEERRSLGLMNLAATFCVGWPSMTFRARLPFRRSMGE